MEYNELLIDSNDIELDVLCVWEMKGQLAEKESHTYRFIPKGQNLLIFDFSQDNEVVFIPAITSSSMVEFKNDNDLFGISFINDGLYKLTGTPIPELKISTIPHLYSKLLLLYSELNGLALKQRKVRVQEFLIENINLNLTNEKFTSANKIINEKKGIIRISELAKTVGCSVRTLQRMFKVRLGITPKNYSKIVRVNRYLDLLLESGQTLDWHDLVVQFDYHDQPHLINEVKSITKLSPEKLIKHRDSLYHRFH